MVSATASGEYKLHSFVVSHDQTEVIMLGEFCNIDANKAGLQEREPTMSQTGHWAFVEPTAGPGHPAHQHLLHLLAR